MSGTSPMGKATSRVRDTKAISMATGSPRWKKKRQLRENVFHTCKAQRGRRRPSGTATQRTHFNDRELRHAPDHLTLRKKKRLLTRHVPEASSTCPRGVFEVRSWRCASHDESPCFQEYLLRVAFFSSIGGLPLVHRSGTCNGA